jgi:tetratricopeptide (TPR) repeat protein
MECGVNGLIPAIWLFLVLPAAADVAGQWTASDYIHQGKAELAGGDDDKAIADFNHATELDPKNVDAVIQRGLAKRDKGDSQGAIADLTHAIQLAPQNVTAYFNRGLARDDVDDSHGAVDDFSEVITLDPTNADAYSHRGGDRQFLGGDGTTDYEKALALDPKNLLAYINRSYARYAKGDFDGTIADCNRIIALQQPKGLEGYQELGLAEYAKRDFAGAVGAWDIFLERAPLAFPCLDNRALAKMCLDDPASALADVNKVIAQAPAYFEAIFIRGSIEWAKGDLAGALSDYERVIQLTGPNANLHSYAHFSLWAVQTQMGQADAANRQLSGYLATKADSTSWYWFPKIGGYLLGRIKESELLGAVTSNPMFRREEQGQAWFYIGMAHLVSGEKAGAADALRKCVALNEERLEPLEYRDDTQYFLARAELKKLGQAP